MNEDGSIRKFLKMLGVSAQREIEKAVRQALAERTAPVRAAGVAARASRHPALSDRIAHGRPWASSARPAQS